MKALKSLGRFGLFAIVIVLFGAFAMLTALWSWWMVLPSVIFGILAGMGVYDLIQTKHSILRNYPVLGHMRFFFEGIRPEIRQYLIESRHCLFLLCILFGCGEFRQTNVEFD